MISCKTNKRYLYSSYDSSELLSNITKGIHFLFIICASSSLDLVESNETLSSKYKLPLFSPEVPKSILLLVIWHNTK